MAARTPRGQLLDRRVQVRDARIFVIATEGRKTEPAYFDVLGENDLIDTSRVRVVLLPTDESNASAPSHLLARLDAFRATQALREDLDETWLVLDVDRWPSAMLAQVAAAAQQKGFQLAVSNPCFELWLLLHFADPLAPGVPCSDYVLALRGVLGGHSKATLDPVRFTRQPIEAAIVRAEGLDTNPRNRWPQSTGTRVYMLVRALLRPPA